MASVSGRQLLARHYTRTVAGLQLGVGRPAFAVRGALTASGSLLYSHLGGRRSLCDLRPPPRVLIGRGDTCEPEDRPVVNKGELHIAFGELFEAYRQPIFAYLYRLLGDLGTAEDVVQDVFLRAYEALPRLAPDANRRAWLYRIATNAARDILRKRKVRRRLLQWLPFSPPGKPEDGGPDEPVDFVQHDLPADERLAVRQALHALDDTYRVPLILFSVQGLSTQEIAQVLGIGQSAVKMRLSRARAMFQSAYGAEPDA